MNGASAKKKYWNTDRRHSEEFRRKISKTSRKWWASLSSKQVKEQTNKIQKNRKFSKKGLLSLSNWMKDSAAEAKLRGTKWGGGGWNKGKKTKKKTVEKQSATMRALVAAGKINPQNSYSWAGSGWVKTKKAGKVYYASGWELKRIKLLDESSLVSLFRKDQVRIPYRFEGKWRTYIPDLMVCCTDGSIFIEEIKPTYHARTAMCKKKFSTARRYCRIRGWKFRHINTFHKVIEMIIGQHVR